MTRMDRDVERRIGFAKAEVARLDGVIREATHKRAIYHEAIEAHEKAKNKSCTIPNEDHP